MSGKPTAEHVAEAMQRAWNDYCTDTSEFPNCFSLEGRMLFADFYRGSWSVHVADHLRHLMAITTEQETE